MITLKVNGKEQELEGAMSLTDFLQRLGIKLRFIAVAYNGEVLRRAEFDKVTLKDGDVLEIVRAVGGG